MADITPTIIPKSDQLNADTLLTGPITILITSVDVNKDSEQPVTIHYQGENGRPYKPGKSMRRVIAHIWGKESSNYPGKSMTLYTDPKVRFGPMEVGGLRISHMSDIDSEITMALTEKKGSKKAFVVKPLRVAREQPQEAATVPQDWVDRLEATIAAGSDAKALHAQLNAALKEPQWQQFRRADPEAAQALRDRATRKVETLKQLDEDDID